MTGTSFRLIPLTLIALFSITVASAQEPYENGYSLTEVTSGLQGPSSIALDSSGRVFVASIHDRYGSGNPTDIYRVQPDGTVELFTAPILDPDVLCLDAAGQVYVGSWPGKITQVDPDTGAQSVWVNDTRLGNVDGMAFDGNGDLLVSAIDHHKIHRVDKTTKAITVFADLTSLGFQGFGSLAVNPADQTVFVATPLDGSLVHLSSSGSVLDSGLATGFQHMGQLALDSTHVYVSDNIAGQLIKVEHTMRQTSVFVHRIEYYAGGLLSVGNGEFLATRQSQDLTDGRLYRITPMTLSLGNTPSIGTELIVNLDSPADAGQPAFCFINLSPGSVSLPDGRVVPVDLSSFILRQTMLDGTGHWQLRLAIPAKSKLIGKTVYLCFITVRPDIFGISKSFTFTIQA